MSEFDPIDNGPLHNSEAPAAPAEDVRGTIAAAWSKVLGAGDITPSDNFFELGGTSLLAMKLIGELERRLNVQIPFICLFDAESLEAFSLEVQALLGTLEERHETSAETV